MAYKYISRQKFQQLKEFAFGQTLHILIPETWQNDMSWNILVLLPDSHIDSQWLMTDE